MVKLCIVIVMPDHHTANLPHIGVGELFVPK